MTLRHERRAVAWAEMAQLAAMGLGELVEVSPMRRKLVLDVRHKRAGTLSTRPIADGFLRADESSFLIRDASDAVRDAFPRQLLRRAMKSDKGLEFRWTALSDLDMLHLFACLRWLAHTGGEAPAAE